MELFAGWFTSNLQWLLAITGDNFVVKFTLGNIVEVSSLGLNWFVFGGGGFRGGRLTDLERQLIIMSTSQIIGRVSIGVWPTENDEWELDLPLAFLAVIYFRIIYSNTVCRQSG